MSDELENLQEELDAAAVALEAARKEAADNLDGWKRAKADYANREKDLVREKSEIIKFANARLLLEFLAVYESLCEAIKNTADEGMALIKKQFEDLFKKHGLEKIETLGQQFDYNLHEAVGTEKSEDAKSGEIIKEIQTGYKLHGAVLRPAKVIVAE